MNYLIHASVLVSVCEQLRAVIILFNSNIFTHTHAVSQVNKWSYAAGPKITLAFTVSVVVCAAAVCVS